MHIYVKYSFYIDLFYMSTFYVWKHIMYNIVSRHYSHIDFINI